MEGRNANTLKRVIEVLPRSEMLHVYTDGFNTVMDISPITKALAEAGAPLLHTPSMQSLASQDLDPTFAELGHLTALTTSTLDSVTVGTIPHFPML
jgi:hypothetical protein